MSPISDITAIESPKLKATLSTPPKLLFLGNSAAIKIYPGKKSVNGSPRIIRAMVEGEKAMTTMSKMVTTPMKQRSLASLTFISNFTYLISFDRAKSSSHCASHIRRVGACPQASHHSVGLGILPGPETLLFPKFLPPVRHFDF